MTDTVITALIGAAQAVTLAILGIVAVRFGRVRRDTSAVRDQVENDHNTNLREENDDRHAKIWARLDVILRRLVAGDERMGRIEQLLLKHENEIDALGDTLSKRKE